MQQQEYDHTYGSYPQNNKENAPYHHHQQQEEAEYYAPTHHDQPEHPYLPEQIHREHSSTQDMLILDRFAGGLGYGYESGYGLSGSAGTRNSGNFLGAGAGRKGVEVAGRWGVDLSDVPVFLRGVRVEA
jgi:hypothetical protein